MNVTNVTKHFPTANKGFITTLGSSILSGATTVPLTSVSGLTNGTIFVGIIEPGQANEQEFTGTVDTAGVQITGVVWTDGTNVDHTAGVTIVDYVSATGQNMQTKALIRDHNQTGYHKTLNDDNGAEWIKQTSTASAVNEVNIANAATGNPPIVAVSGSDTNIDLKLDPKGSGQVVIDGRYDGWATNALPAVSSVTNNGNRSYDVVFDSTVASILSPGMRLRTTRTVAAPQTSFSLDGSNDYYNDTSLTGVTFTDDFVVGAWVYLTSYPSGANAYVMSRYNGTSGWSLQIQASGQVLLAGFNGGAANTSYVLSYQSVPLNKWVHISAQLDMSAFTATTTTSYVMIDGVNVPASVTRSGTNPTALVQAGNLEVGSGNGGLLPFPGYIDQVFVSSAKITQANIKTLMSQGLTASDVSTHSIVSAYSNGSTTDLNTTNANNLTAQNGATTAAKSPFGNNATSSTLDYALVMSVSTTTATVQVPEGCTIPTSGGVTSVDYSVQGNPFGWVSDKGRWSVKSILKTDNTTTSNATYGSFISGGFSLIVPVGGWTVGWQAGGTGSLVTTSVIFNFSSTVLTGMTAADGLNASRLCAAARASTAALAYSPTRVVDDFTITSPATFVMYTQGATTGAFINAAAAGVAEAFAEPSGL